MNKEKIDKPQKQKNPSTHNFGKISPLETQHITINHQTIYTFKLSTTDPFLSSSISSDSNTIAIKEINQTNYRPKKPYITPPTTVI